MKNLIESFAVLLVGILSALIIYLIVQYNMIEDDNFIEDLAYVAPVKKKETTKSYLDDMEKYSDVDVKVDPTKDDTTNSVHVKSELAKDRLHDTVSDTSKSTYMKNLDNYTEKVETKTVLKKKKVEKVEKIEKDSVVKPDDNPGMDEFRNALDSIVDDEEEAPTPVTSNKEDENVDDEIRMAIDAALEDL